ncbi:MAG: hypothetical protein J6A58_11050 [Oscillospiraceae bacterium]|nr:hypothetical protein [Oscillospiraceae bacterium]
MILVFAPAPMELVFPLTYVCSHFPNEEVVLFVHEGLYKSRKMIEYVDNMKKNHVIKDVVYCDCLYTRNDFDDVDSYREAFILHFDNLFLNSGYSIKDFDKIICVNDNWDGDLNLYLNLKKVSYFWLQVVCNNLIIQKGCMRNYKYLNTLVEEYSAYSGIAEYATPILRSDSDKNISTIGKRKYLLWDLNFDILEISNDCLNAILKSFNFSEKCILNASIIIMNSFGFTKRVGWSEAIEYIKRRIGFRDYPENDIYTIAYSMAIDYYINDSDINVFVKCHPNDPISDANLKEYYGRKACEFNRAPFQYIVEYMVRNKKCANSILSFMSTSTENLNNSICNNEWCLGKEYFRTFPFYTSLYAISLITRDLNINHVYSMPFIGTQIKMLNKKNQYKTNAHTYTDLSNLDSVNGSIIIIDTSVQIIKSSLIRLLAKKNLICFVNSEFSEDCSLLNFLEDSISLRLSKRLFEERCVPKIYYDEYVWLYSDNIKFINDIMTFKFSKKLYCTGIEVNAKILSVQEKYDNIDRMKTRIMYKDFYNLKSQYNKLSDIINSIIVENNNFLIRKRFFSTIIEVDLYFDLLFKMRSDYLLLFSVKDTPSGHLNKETIDMIRDLGFKKFTTKLWQMYVGIIDCGNVIIDETGNAPEDNVEINWCNEFNDLEIFISSKAWRNGNKSEIIINGMDYSTNVRGINLVVYDKLNCKVIDSVGIDAYNKDICFKRNNIQ